MNTNRKCLFFMATDWLGMALMTHGSVPGKGWWRWRPWYGEVLHGCASSESHPTAKSLFLPPGRRPGLRLSQRLFIFTSCLVSGCGPDLKAVPHSGSQAAACQSSPETWASLQWTGVAEPAGPTSTKDSSCVTYGHWKCWNSALWTFLVLLQEMYKYFYFFIYIMIINLSFILPYCSLKFKNNIC